MPTIPTVPLSSVPQAPAVAPRGDAGAYNATNRAITQAGGALADVGQMLGRFAIQKQEQVNKGLLASEETIRMETAASVEAYAMQNPDNPEQWDKFRESTWKGYEQGRAKRVKEQKWGPDVVKQDDLLTKSYQAETGVRFRTMRDKAMIRQANARLEANMDTHIASGNVNAAMAAIEAMDASPEAKDMMRADVLPKLQYQSAVKDINADPFSAFEIISDEENYKSLSASQRFNLRDMAKNKIVSERTATAEAIQERRFAGEVIDKEELDGLVESKRLKATTAKAIMAEQERQVSGRAVSITSKAGAARVLADINRYDPGEDVSMEQWVELAEQATGLPKGPIMDEAISRLKAKKPDTAEDQGLPRKAIRKQLGGMLDAGLFGKIKPEVSGDKVDKGEYLGAYDQFNRASDAMETWFAANPNATQEDAGKQLAVILDAPYREAASRAIAPAGKPTPKAGTQAALDILKIYRLDSAP